MPAPRPILKGLRLSPSFLSPETASNPLPFSSCATVLDSPHVHFPPTPTLASMETTHSAIIYDRAPIVVTPNACALPERGGRMLFGSNGNQGGLGYFHHYAKFQEPVSPTMFSANVTVSDCGSMGLFRKNGSGPMYEYDYDYEYDQYSSHDQHTQHTQHVISSLVLKPSSESSDLGVFCSPPAIYVSSPSSSPSSSSSSPLSIPHSSVNISPQDLYDSLTAPLSPSSTATNNDAATHSDAKRIHKKKSSVDVGGKKRRKSREYTLNPVEGEGGIQWTTMLRPGDSGTRRELELEGCLGGF